MVKTMMKFDLALLEEHIVSQPGSRASSTEFFL